MPEVIREFAAAKINLALHVLGRRADGYHELDSVVAFANVGDVLTFAPSQQTVLTVDGPFAGDVPVSADNLILKAHAALALQHAVPPLSIHLTKNLPVAAGIGGGSADAAAAIRGISACADLRFDSETVQKIALSLGADVPVCLYGRACRMQGVGEVITPVEQLPAPSVVLVNPLKACSTADVFRAMGLQPGDVMGPALDPARPGQWRNDMTGAAIEVLPDIGLVLNTLEDIADTVRMSGSGATCFALFDDFVAAQAAAERLRPKKPDWWVAPARLS
jgi:4-diphosphocytidyl-2-C-methyl-D-erythritol kinase